MPAALWRIQMGEALVDGFLADGRKGEGDLAGESTKVRGSGLQLAGSGCGVQMNLPQLPAKRGWSRASIEYLPGPARKSVSIAAR